MTAALASLLPAHGGQYRGNPDSPPGPGAAPPTPGVRTGVRPVAPTSVMWQTWWEFNKDSFLRQRTVADQTSAAVTGSDDFYLGQRKAAKKVDLLMPTIADRRDLIVPALAALMARERNRDIVSACLVALGKVGLDGPDVDLEAVMTAQIRRDDQEVRETAVLALGIAGREKALPSLLALACNTSQGRRLEDRLEEVTKRTRAFAAFGLGMLARRSKDLAIKQQVRDTCLELARDDKLDRELRVAALSSLGILDLESPSGGHKRLLWSTVDELAALYAKPVGATDETTLSHAAIAIHRLLGRGTTAAHRRIKQQMADELTARSHRGNSILRSAVITLGALAVSPEQDPDDAVFSKVLQQTYEKGADQHTRLFALISLGRIGGAQNREFLLRSYQHGNKLTEQPWAALALGLLAFDAANGDAGRGVDKTVAQLLLDDLESTGEDTLRGALAVAIGLCGYVEAAAKMRRILLANEREQMSAGYLCVGLGLLGDRESIPTLSEVLDRSLRRPFLMQHCAVALGMLGDRDASQRLLDKMKESDSAAALASLATAIGRIGDRRSIEPMITLMSDKEHTKLARAFVAAALGGVGDKDSEPWNLPLSRDSNYASPTNTLTNGSTGVLDIL
ncbi:MAG: hypothetical protein KDC98_20965 [Planctomycetes bacterium]|nr:hypothetical protein [Planctomycetota bacterium]